MRSEYTTRGAAIRTRSRRRVASTRSRPAGRCSPGRSKMRTLVVLEADTVSVQHDAGDVPAEHVETQLAAALQIGEDGDREAAVRHHLQLAGEPRLDAAVPDRAAGVHVARSDVSPVAVPR